MAIVEKEKAMMQKAKRNVGTANIHAASGTSVVYHTRLGKIVITADDEAVTAIRFGELTAETKYGQSALADMAVEQIEEYFAGKRTKFTVPLSPKGSEFQKRVWAALQDIPYGQTRSYKQIAEQIGCPVASRAVGMANSKNPIWIMIPCHRVVGSDGSLVGYAGGLQLKQFLLDLEAKALNNMD